MQSTTMKQKLVLITSGLFLSLLLIESGLHIGGWILLSFQKFQNIIPIQQKATYRILCLGDSMTAFGGRYSYPSQLEEILNQHIQGKKFKVINKGVPGTQTINILALLESNLTKYKPDIVITLMGTNDNYMTMPPTDTLSRKIKIFIRSFKTYKLVEYLKSYILSKIKEIKTGLPTKNEKTYSKNRILEIENKLQSSLEINPGNQRELNELDKAYATYMEYMNYYLAQGETNKAQEMIIAIEEMAKKIIQLNPENYFAYIGLFEIYTKKGEIDFADKVIVKAEGIIEKALEKNSKNYTAFEAYRSLIGSYQTRGKTDKAKELMQKLEGIYRRALKVDLNDDVIYYRLALSYNDQRMYDKSIEMLNKAIEINPANDEASIALAEQYSYNGNFDKAERILLNNIEFQTENDEVYRSLGKLYRLQGKYKLAKESLKKAIEINSTNSDAQDEMTILSFQQNEMGGISDIHFTELNKSKINYFNPISVYMYRSLKETVNAKGAKLISVQYPMLPVEPLKRIFKDLNGIVFVDNENEFKKAVERDGYEKYFSDRAGGVFGHCTAAGNKLLAENISKVILNGYFN